MVLYNTSKANVIADALSHMRMGSVSHIKEENNVLTKDVHRLARLSVRLEDSPNGCFVVHNNT